MTVGSAFSISGRVIIDGQSDRSGAERVRAQLRYLNGPISSSQAGGVSPLSAQAGTDGTFRFDNVLPGDYRAGFAVTGAAPLPEYYIKEASMDRHDALNQPLQVSEAMARGAVLNIVLSPNVGRSKALSPMIRRNPCPGFKPFSSLNEAAIEPNFTKLRRPIRMGDSRSEP